MAAMSPCHPTPVALQSALTRFNISYTSCAPPTNRALAQTSVLLHPVRLPRRPRAPFAPPLFSYPHPNGRSASSGVSDSRVPLRSQRTRTSTTSRAFDSGPHAHTYVEVKKVPGCSIPPRDRDARILASRQNPPHASLRSTGTQIPVAPLRGALAGQRYY
ncbi:hypothetical protein B0H15DRAFT_869786, partial [Mycena belliarum]